MTQTFDNIFACSRRTIHTKVGTLRREITVCWPGDWDACHIRIQVAAGAGAAAGTTHCDHGCEWQREVELISRSAAAGRCRAECGGGVAGTGGRAAIDTVGGAGDHWRHRAQGRAAGAGDGTQEASEPEAGIQRDLFGYSIELGYPPPSRSLFSLDPEIKRECIWHGSLYRRA